MSTKTRVAINGFGRIGRVFLRNAISDPNIEIVIINDLTDAGTLAHLLKYDSIHRAFPVTVSAENDHLIVNGQRIKVVSFKDPAQLPWKEYKIDQVIESTGHFLDRKALNYICQLALERLCSLPLPRMTALSR